MISELAQTQKIVDLLRQTTSLPIVSEFLKAKNLTYSAGSWDDMLAKRIVPAIESGSLSNADLIVLLRSAEEHGHQHVFLYSCVEAKAIELIDRARITPILQAQGLDHLLDSPEVLGEPVEPKIVDVRWESALVDLSLTIKQIELRTYTRYVGIEEHGERFHKVYEHVRQRAVNVAKLHRSGLLEIRIASLENSSKYEANILRFLKTIELMIPSIDFSELSLSIAKNRIWAERATLAPLIKYNNSTIRDLAGNVLRAATGSDDSDLGENHAVSESLDYLLANDKNAYCDGTNISFRKNADLSTESRVLLAGEVNEFALTANCNEEDYDYVLNKIRSFNKAVP